ncbi:replication initiation protein [Clostridium sp. Marseille-Q2269]|uniref:replication initiation protein n=1 Tax=Clostridium sp. Marseille-Q2269 TaxID=2942205 RepID=UPI0020743471|nr:replication initiation protein [Clostridium sp. Marseille-Q2269]
MGKGYNKETALVCKHNNLINASYKLNLGEQKIILAISSMVNPKDEEFKDYYLSVNEFAKLMNINLSKNTALYSRLKRKSSMLLSKRVTIHEPDGDLQSTWFASIKYFDKEGKMAFCFAPRLKKYYLQLQQYTKYRLKNISNLNSEYSIRVYELLKQYEKLKIRIMDMDEFKNAIGLDKEQYPRFYDLKKRVLLVSEKELKEKTDISFDFEEIKVGRKVTGIKFYITKNKKDEILDEMAISLEDNSIDDKSSVEKDYIKKVKDIFHEDIRTSDIIKIYNMAKGDISLIKEKYEISKKYEINSIVGFMLSALMDDYPENIPSPKKDTFNDFEQRTYDFKKLEEKLLGI